MSNLKKHASRSALRAVHVWRWTIKGILTIKIVKGSPIFYLAEGKSVRQNWLRKKRQTIKRESAVTYLRKGLFLVPSWRKVPDWEIQHLKANNASLCEHSILYLHDGYNRLIYMQVEDLDHTRRQQEHIIDHYSDVKTLLRLTSPELFKEINKESRIIRKIGEQKIAADSRDTRTRLRIDSIRRSLCSIVANAPIFKKGFSEKDIQPVISFLENAVREISSFTFRPINRRIGYTRRSLELTIKHLGNNRFSLARDRLRSAIKNFQYPTEDSN